MKNLKFFALIIPLSLLSLSALGATVNVTASVWGTARDAGPNGNFESISFPNAIVLQRKLSDNLIDRGIWEFDLSDFPSGTILGVSLELSVGSTTLELTPYDVYGYIGNGTIEPADVLAESVLATNLDGSLVTSTFDVTSFIFDPDVQAAGFAGFMARYANETSGSDVFKQLAPPLLVVEYSTVPVPASIWLFGSALGLLGGWIRRKSK